MNNFDFYNPTRIVFGENTIAQLDQLVAKDAKILLLYGGQSAKKTGTLDEVKVALGDRQVQEFGGIEPNPTYETLMKAVMLIREQQFDFLLAVGGGSVIDGTKFIAAAALFDKEQDPWSIMENYGNNIKQALPFGSVLTLPATGSEMNNGGVVTHKAKQAKLPFRSPLVYPQFSILDPVKTYTLPERQIANGVVDAFVHTVEQYLTYPVDGMVQDRFAEGLLQTLIEIGPKALAEPQNYSVRANIMWAATMALNGLIGAGVPQDWATHMVGHELTARHGIDHARTLAIVLPGMLQIRKQSKAAKLKQYAERVWLITEGSDEQKIDAAIAKTEAFFEQMGIGTHLSDYGLDESTVAPLIEQLTKHGMITLGEHGDVTPEMSQEVLISRL
ncbi:iron-containing alcohol dehydrogenase [Celerinatantimonas yamalensis]|uniref:Iron-containing alcohol dehydrogenase n=1 Tax=Celerinatantimonas yamalensis TaxID=559956 RepID=A0ABW9G7R4_9GAMM